MEAQESFDPYVKWFGIRSRRRPPNHYRLLGVAIFESDPEVISNAADARITHLRNFQTGPHKALAEKILQEIKEAEMTLLDAEKKAVYDAQLHKELQAEGEEIPSLPSVPSSSVFPPPQVPVPRTTAWADPVEGAASSPVGSSPSATGRLFQSRAVWLASLAMIGVLLVVGGLIAVIASRRSSPPEGEEVAWVPTEESEAENSSVSEGQNSSGEQSSAGTSSGSSGSPSSESTSSTSGSLPNQKLPSSEQRMESPSEEKPGSSVSVDNSSTSSSSSTQPKPASPESPGSKLEPGMSESETAPKTPVEKSSEEKSPQEKSKELGGSEQEGLGPGVMSSEEEKTPQKPEGSASPTEKPTPEQPAEKKPLWPMPSTEDQKRAESLIRSLFKEELSSAKLPPEKLTLAEKLFKEAVATQDDPPAAYVLFGLSSGLAAGGGDFRKSLEIIETAGTRFSMNPAAMKLEVLEKALLGLRNSPQPGFLAYELADLALAIMEEAVLTDQIDLAAQAYKLASGVVKRSGDNELIQEVFGRNHCLQVLQKQYEAVQAAEKQLAVSPEDQTANATIGRWHCFFKGLWEKGLPYLTRAQPEELTSLAKADLQTPEDPKSQFLVAEGWLKYADSEIDDAKGHIQLRAAYWYRQALPGLSGLDKIRAEKQLEKLPTAPPLFVRRPRGEVVPGNVALSIAGAKVTGVNTTGEYLIDGRLLERFSAYGQSPVTWTITLPKLYSLREIRLLIVNRSGYRLKHYGYILGVSTDGKRFTPLVDRSKGQWIGWQVISFPARPVRAIQLIGLRESGDREFAAVELEAYCVPPQYPPGTPSEPPPGVVSEESSLGPPGKSPPPKENTPDREGERGEKRPPKPLAPE